MLIFIGRELLNDQKQLSDLVHDSIVNELNWTKIVNSCIRYSAAAAASVVSSSSTFASSSSTHTNTCTLADRQLRKQHQDNAQ